jgi:hypothetical protein
MLFTVIFIGALVPVLLMGSFLMNLIFEAAPRRGKRPDFTENNPPRLMLVRVVTDEGRLMRGTPCQVVRRLGGLWGVVTPFWLTEPLADQFIAQWEQEGRILVMGDWGG